MQDTNGVVKYYFTYHGEHMEPHQERILDEKGELDVRIAKLAAFVGNKDFAQTVPEHERYLLYMQLGAMRHYAELLSRRIDLF